MQDGALHHTPDKAMDRGFAIVPWPSVVLMWKRRLALPSGRRWKCRHENQAVLQ
ncbi:hypothetical protein CGRA01v4_00910 [Colletotrichum graminicola]|nr:hypothetical protein CGRA01v4_00910 [Colletotrichum graminicola]